MSLQAPDIDSRNGQDITRQVVELARIYAPDWKEYDPVTGLPIGMSAAIIGAFARFCEIIIRRINRVPQKNFLAFFDMLGVSLQPPQPARVPLIFSCASGNTNAVNVPAGTRAAAPPAQGEKDPVIFETETDLVVSPSQLINVFMRNPLTDKYADLRAVLQSAPADIAVYDGSSADEHILYIAAGKQLGLPAISNMILSFSIEAAGSSLDPRSVIWQQLDGTALPLSNGGDRTGNLTTSGNVSFGKMGPVPLSVLNGTEIENRWICCRLITPVTAGMQGVNGMVREDHIPKIRSIYVQVRTDASGLLPQSALSNNTLLDLINPVHPFGEKPRFADAFYLACDQAFSLPNCSVELDISLINPSGSSMSDPKPVSASADLALTWEIWNGSIWHSLIVTEDLSERFTKSGKVKFIVPVIPVRKTINGIEGFWIRVRISNGNYGKEAYYTPVNSSDLSKGYVFHPSTYAPPVIGSVSINYSATITQVPEAVVIRNDFSILDVTESFTSGVALRPFRAMADTRPSLYLGFALPSILQKFPNTALSFYMRFVDLKYGEVSALSDPEAGSEPLRVKWEYWNGNKWSGLSVRDESHNLTRSGIISMLPPLDFTRHSEFDLDAFWIRAVWEAGVYRAAPRLKFIQLNTVMASQAVTARNEILGSSDQSEFQHFKTSSSPVLPGQQLMVREGEIPPGLELAVIKEEEGDDAVKVITDTSGNVVEIWVRWHEVEDFYASGHRDRHYCIDHQTGIITFGNNVNGMIPPQGAGNIKMAFYRTGGGQKGNRPAGSISQLKTTVPYVEKVINMEASAGGADSESIESLIERAPRALRHGNRSVAVEDYEDLTRAASFAVARTKCFPLLDLKTDPFAASVTPGTVSVIIVPRTADVKPFPTLELINLVQKSLERHCPPTADVLVTGPLYLRVDVRVTVTLSELEKAGTLETVIRERLAAFLHPLTGGLDGKGWEFGRLPFKSDLYALLRPVPGIDHISSLTIDDTAEDPAGKIRKTGRFLVYSGNHTVILTY